MPLLPGRKVPLEDRGLQWTNPLFFAEFRRKFLTRVYFFLTFQWFLVSSISFISPFIINTFKQDEILTCISFGSSLLVFAYLLLCLYSCNNLDSPTSSKVMQIIFTIALSVFFATSSVLPNSEKHYVYAPRIITVCCLISALLYHYKLFECHLLSGVCFIFYVQLFITGLIMMWDQRDGIMVEGGLAGIITSSIIMLYLEYGTMQLILCKFAHFKLEDYVYGTTLIYTFFLIPYYYKIKLMIHTM